MKEDDSAVSEPIVDTANDQQSNNIGREKRIIGMVACIGGIICLIIWGLISVLMPSTSDQIGGSSMITIDGNGIFLLICLVAIVAGAVLLLKSTSNK